MREPCGRPPRTAARSWGKGCKERQMRQQLKAGGLKLQARLEVQRGRN
ncbi:MAG: hypothetical protein ACYDHX_09350 [Methanothrix sp.]